jgi:nitroreductase
VKNLDLEKMPERQLIEEILEAAMWAPNHHLTEPWRFIVIARSERLRLGNSMAEALRSTMKSDDPRVEEVLKREREKTLRAPVIIAVISSQTGGEKIVPQEEMVAAGAALQNILLAAHSLGLGSIVKTGPHSYLQPVRAYLELQEKESLVGLVYLGYPTEQPGLSKRSPLESKVQWRGF